MIDIDTIKRADKFKVFSWVYVSLGFLIVLFPPKLNYNKTFEGKYGFFTSVTNVDFYFFMYEIISYSLMGAIIYFLFFKDRRKKMTLEEKETEALKHGGV